MLAVNIPNYRLQSSSFIRVQVNNIIIAIELESRKPQTNMMIVLFIYFDYTVSVF